MVSLRSALKATNCAVESTILEDDDPTICPACHKRFKTSRGVQSHLQSAKSCTWYKKGKLRALTTPGQFEEAILFQDLPEAETLPDGLTEEVASDDMEPHEVMDDFYERIFELIPADGFDLDAPGPLSLRPRCASKSPPPEYEDDDRLVVEHPTAGQHIRIVPTLHERWKKLFGGSMENDDEEEAEVDSDVDMDGEQEHKFAPFASELDWRVARWAVQEGIGHKSFDRLMLIPGVCTDDLSC
jgi:hypothetical protein